MTAYYNEINPTAAQWLRNLIAAGHIAPGVVDERSIEDVIPDELREFTQCHFFAGIGVWSYALRLPGWPDNRPIWTGSCPCQPFSQAGKGAGFDDERHLWPAFFHLISECRPGVVFGEQVASKDGLAWIDLVQTDLEATGHASGAVDLCAAGLGAPNIRQRLYWVAHPSGQLMEMGWQPRARGGNESPDGSEAIRLGDSVGERCEGQRLQHVKRSNNPEITGSSEVSWLGDAHDTGPQRGVLGRKDSGRQTINGHIGCNSPTYRPLEVNGFWRAADWIWCRDGKWRPIESGVEPLANGTPCRVGRLRAYGNAINAEAARAFIASYMESQNDPL